MKRWKVIKRKLEVLDRERQRLTNELKSEQKFCRHARLPERLPGEEHCDECPECGYVAYCYKLG